MDYAASDIGVLDHADYEYSVPDVRTVSREPASFSSLERAVIHLSRQDAPASIADLDGWRVNIARRLSPRRKNFLANDRLEALRRFSILARVKNDREGDALTRFLDAGYSHRQAELVGQLLDEWDVAQAHSRSGLLIWAGLALFAVLIFFLTQSVTDEMIVSAISASVALATMASFAAPRNAPSH